MITNMKPDIKIRSTQTRLKIKFDESVEIEKRERNDIKDHIRRLYVN